MKVSVVVPTYNRGERIAPTISGLLASDITGLDLLEILVIDDGSSVSPAETVSSFEAKSPICLRLIRQENQGPAAARNHGFRLSCGDIVIFMDDDILPPAGLVLDHVRAHRLNPRSVICGRCPFLSDEMTPLLQYVTSLGGDPGADQADEFAEIDVVASGQLSVEKSMFDDAGVYRDDLATPAAEEFELSLRLRENGIPILLAKRIVALHDHPVLIESMCRQQFKHGIGCGEAAAKYPAVLGLSALSSIVRVNGPIAPGDSPLLILKKGLKTPLSLAGLRKALVRMASKAEQANAGYAVLKKLYGLCIAAHFLRE